MQPESETAKSEPVPGRVAEFAPNLRGPVRRAVILTGNLSYSVRKGIVELVRDFPDTSWLILEQAPRRSIRILLRNQWRNIRKNGWRWFPYQARDMAARLALKLRRHPTRFGAAPGEQYEASKILCSTTVRHLRVPDIHGEDVLGRVREFAPDLGISLAAPILKASLFELPARGTINLHKGKLPDYRGMPPAFWEFANGEPEVGCTVHRIERGLDTGPIIAQATVTRARYATVRGVQLALDELGVRMMCDAVRSLSEGTVNWQAQGAGGRTYTKPTLRQLALADKQWRTCGTDSKLRRVCKDALFWSYIWLGRPVARLYQGWRNRQRVIILLYHRVNDDMRDSLTVGIEQFDAHMEWLSRHHCLVSIADIVHGTAPRNTSRTAVAVTFDDGYLDNYEHAVPILLRHRIPAAFFVSTGLIGRSEGFAHDLNRLGRPLPTMTWEQLKHMRDLGFTIGSHTVTHLDCGQATEDTVKLELIESRDILKQNLGLDEVIFAYPFGGRRNMTAPVLRMVRESGYAGCLSAYGGFIDDRIDPFNVEREGIDCNFSMLAFRARLEGFS
ncbi:MAG: polysaccharide deacetylase family protein [Betaproteobacteria bacterium]